MPSHDADAPAEPVASLHDRDCITVIDEGGRPRWGYVSGAIASLRTDVWWVYDGATGRNLGVVGLDEENVHWIRGIHVTGPEAVALEAAHALARR